MRELLWKHRGWWARRWDLVEGDRVLATLEQTGWGWGAKLQHGARRYRLGLGGVLRWTMRVVDDDGSPVASMKLGWRGQGAPELADGRAFSWDAENWWGTRWTLDQVGGGRIARVHMSSFLRLDARMEVEPSALSEEDLVVLLALTWLAVVVTAQAASSAGAG